jgi:hypothetical protein
VQLANPQPPAGDEGWEGNDPADGGVYTFACPQPNGSVTLETHFLEEAPALPSASELAQQAIGQLNLVGAQIGIAPDPDGVGLVGVPVWLWTENTAETWGPISTSVSVPGLEVTARAQATRILWEMGDGTTVECDSPGEPYRPEYGDREPECGHVYQYPSLSQPDGRYQITAVTDWHVEWSATNGASGDQDFTRESSTSVEIHELQVVTS